MNRELIERIESIIITIALMVGVLLIVFHWR
jgi:hypothetical protein